MAVTTEKSTQLTGLAAQPIVYPQAVDAGGRLAMYYFDFTQGAAAGDANSTVDLIKIPAGRKRVYLNLWVGHSSAFGAARVIDIGHTGFTDLDGTVIAADPDLLIDGWDVSSAAIKTFVSGIQNANLDDVRSFLFESKQDITIQAICTGGTIPAAATLRGYFMVGSE